MTKERTTKERRGWFSFDIRIIVVLKLNWLLVNSSYPFSATPGPSPPTTYHHWVIYSHLETHSGELRVAPPG